MAALFGAGHPGHRGRRPRPEHLRVARRLLYNLFRFPQEFPKADGTPAPQLPLYTNFRSGARILAAADAVIGAVPEAQRPARASGSCRSSPTGRARCASCGVLDEWTEARRIADRCVALHAAGSAWSEIAVLCRTSPAVHAAAPGLRRARGAGRDRRARRAAAHARGGRGVGVRPRGAGPDRQRGAGPHPARRRATGSASRTSRLLARLATEKTKSLRDDYELEDDDIESQPVPVGRGARAPRGRRGRCPRRAASGWRSSARSCGRCASRRAGRSASSWARSSGASASSTSWTPTPTGGAARARGATSRRSSTRSTRSSRSTASSRCACSWITSTRWSGSTSRSGRRCSPPTPTRSRS